MHDYYQILGVSASATQAEIRTAYIAVMKRLHPDATARGAYGEMDPGLVTHAYWHLRDVNRRAAHDRSLRPAPSNRKPAQRRGAPSRLQPISGRSLSPPRPKPAGRKSALSARARRRRMYRLQPLRRASGAAACAIGAALLAVTLTYEPPRPAEARATAAPGEFAESSTRIRRAADPWMAKAAESEFEHVFRQAGLTGAHTYARQCLTQLATNPSLSMLDYCVAFDDAASEREEARAFAADVGRFFSDGQRFARYRSAAQDVLDEEVRQALLVEASLFRE